MQDPANKPHSLISQRYRYFVRDNFANGAGSVQPKRLFGGGHWLSDTEGSFA